MARRLRGPIVVLAVLVLGGFALALRGSGIKTRLLVRLVPSYRDSLPVPQMNFATPIDGAVGQPLDATLAAFFTVNGGLDPASINDQTIELLRTGDQVLTPIEVALLEGGSRVEVRPKQPLRPRTQYTLVYSAGIADRFGRPLEPQVISFTTVGTSDPSVGFEPVALPQASGAGFTCVVMGPDKCLWAGSDDGRIFRFPIAADGTLEAPRVFDGLIRSHGGNRILTGSCFDPNCPPDRPVLWLSHGFGSFNNPPDFSGKISRLSGANLEICRDVVVGLPRSVRDHLNNQPSFGPDGALYWSQPSNTAYGQADSIWGMRQEHLLNASILRLDVSRWSVDARPIDARTMEAGGSYDPRAPGAPLTIYASGVRLAYDLLWHSNGRLYAPVNGSAAGGNTPAGGGKGVALTSIPLDEDDWLLRITPGKYYGHPNPAQGYFVLNGGNPTRRYDFAEMPLYPVGTQPEANWQPAIYDFGRHASANGIIEYRDVAFGAKLDKTLMVCRFNFGSDILVLHLDEQGNVVSDDCTIPGLQQLAGPLDLTEDRANGNLYVSEYTRQRLTLLKPVRR